MLTDAVLLDISQAQRQIDQLESELRRLSQPVKVPIDIEGGQAADELRRDFQGADTGVSNLNAELAETDRELDRVRTSADRTGRELEQTGRRGITAFGNIGTAVAGFGAALGAAAGLRAFIGFASQAIDKAADLAESVSKTEVVFGGLATRIKSFASDAPQALGLSTQAALEATSTFGNLFVALGLTQEEAADLSPEIVQLAADLASFNNIEVGDALEKLRSGLVGEAEPLRVLGVNINEATTKAKAFELGLVGTNGELSEAAKVQARYALILEQTVTAQGDFARTADGVANTQRTLTAEWENAQVVIGQALLPAYQQILEILPSLIGQMEDLGPAIAIVTGVALNSLQVVGDLAIAFGDVAVFAGDIIGLVPDVLGLGTAAEGAGSGLGFIGDAIKDSLNPIGIFNKALDDIETRLSGIDPNTFKDVIEDLTNAAAQGVNPLQSLSIALNDFLANSELTADALEAIVQASGIQGADLTLFLSNTIQNADRLKISAAGVRVLKDALVELQDFQRRTPGGSFEIIDPTKIDEATGAINDFDLSLESLSTQDTVAQIDRLANSFSTLEPNIADLPGIMGAVNDALQTEGDEVLETLDGFIEDLQNKFKEQNEFQGNLVLLRALGLDELADTFEAAGLDAAQALADAITDPDSAAEANRLLEDQAATQARLFKEKFNSELSGFIATLPVDVILQQIQIPQIQAALNIAPIGGGQGVGDIITNFYGVTPDELPSTAERAVQIINSGVNQSRSGPS